MSEYNSEIEEIEIASIGELAEQMVYRLSGCDPTMVRKQLQVAFADFARVTRCFTTERVIETKDGVVEYPIMPTLPQMYVDTISAVWIDNRRLTCPEQYRAVISHGRPTVVLTDSNIGTPNYLFERPDGSTTNMATRFAVESRGFEPQKLRVRLIEQPKIGSEVAPRWFYDKYGEAVVAGAFVRLFNMTGKAWSDAAQGQAELLRYENFTTNARLDSVAEEGSPVGNGHINTIDTSMLV